MKDLVVMITGSRHYDDYDTILSWLTKLDERYPNAPKRLLHGGARGADTLGERAATALGWETQVFPADWKQYGRKAGPIRNQQMIDMQPHVLFAFPLQNSIGTWDAVRRAQHANIPVRILEEHIA